MNSTSAQDRAALVLKVRTDPRPSTVVGPELGVSEAWVRQWRNPRIHPEGPWPQQRLEWRQGTHHRDVRGERHPGALLTVAAVRWARRQREKFDTPYPALAEKVATRFRLSRVPSACTIGLAVTGATWGVVDG